MSTTTSNRSQPRKRLIHDDWECIPKNHPPVVLGVLKDEQHTNHPGWLVTVRHSTTGLEVARSFGRLSTRGFGLRLHRLNPCRYIFATRWDGDTLINSYGICETSGISNHFKIFPDNARVQEHVGAGNEFPLNFQSSNVLQTDSTKFFENCNFHPWWNCQVPWASRMVVLCPWRVAWLWRRCPRPYDAWRWVAGGVRRSATWGSNPIGEGRLVVVGWKRLVGQSDQQQKNGILACFLAVVRVVSLSEVILWLFRGKRKHLNLERDWNLHPPRSWLSDDLGPGISVEAWKVAWLNCCMHIVHTYYHDL